MRSFMPKLVPAPVKYAPMSLDDRRALLPRHNINSTAPAVKFEDALIAGNGRIRLDVLGDPVNERMTFMHELLFEPKWDKTPLPPPMVEIMPEVRRLMRENRMEDAARMMNQLLKDKAPETIARITPEGIVWPHSPLRQHSAFWLNLTQPQEGEIRNYLRWLDMHSGEVTVRWETDKGVYTRTALSSIEQNVMYQRYTAPVAGGLNMELSMTMPDGNSASGRGDFGSKAEYDYGALEFPETAKFSTLISSDMLIMACAYNPDFGHRGYTACTHVIRMGGRSRVCGDKLCITGANSIVLATRIYKYESDFDIERTPLTGIAEMRRFAADYDGALASNRAILTEKMDRSVMEYEGSDWALSAEEVLQRQHGMGEIDPTLLEKLYDMGRFFHITDNGELPPHWGHHNVNINLQVCSGNITGLFEEIDNYIRFFEDKFDDFRTNAQRLFGARGMLASVHCDYNSGLQYHAGYQHPHHCWTGSLGWNYNEGWNYYLVTGDKEFLRDRVIPVYKEIALFFEDYACDRDENGKAIFYPNYSPENPSPLTTDGRNCPPASVNGLMDIMICREVLQNLIDGCNDLGIEQDNIAHWQEQLDLLPDYLLDEEGGLKEWAWPTIEENYNHRHVSHHYDAWPGHYVTWERTPELAQAMLISNRKRAQQNDSAHGIMHRLFTAVRLKDTEDAVHNLRQLLEHGFVTRSLTTMHYPYFMHCPDMQGGIPAVLAEMAVFSEPGTVELLPAMPASLPKGRVNALWLYTFARVNDLEWDRAARRITCRLTSLRDQKLCLRYRYGLKAITADGVALAIDGDHAELTIAAGQTVELELSI